MPTPVDVAKSYVAELTKRGVRATHDPRKIVAPCVLIAPPTVSLDTNCGGTADWTAYVLAATGVGNSDAWSQLDEMTAKILPVLPAEVVTPASYSVDDTTAYPAFTITWTESVEWSA